MNLCDVYLVVVANGDLGAQYHVDWFLATLHPLDLLVNEAANSR